MPTINISYQRKKLSGFPDPSILGLSLIYKSQRMRWCMCCASKINIGESVMSLAIKRSTGTCYSVYIHVNCLPKAFTRVK